MSGTKPASRTPYKAPRATGEIVKAVAAAAGVVVFTVVAIWLIKPDDSTSTPAPAPAVSSTAPSASTTPTTLGSPSSSTP